MTTKKLTILHSNDMHGDFLAEEIGEVSVGGLSLLSGYINRVRSEEENVIYAIAGDMFRGSIIDSEFKGISTIEMMNILAPDIATIGNHEIDYGLSHLLFIEKCAKFPIVNANFFITLNNQRIFAPYKIIEAGGLKIMFIGIITMEVLATLKGEELIGTFVDVKEAAAEVSVICDNYKTTDVDFTVLLTHIGLEQDKELARILSQSEWGVDLIIGGHSHTFMDKPEVVNGIPIVHAGCGTDQIGRIDITIDESGRKILGYEWQCVPINEDTAPRDTALEDALNAYKSQTDKKYNRVITRLKKELTHPTRIQETSLGNLFADMLQEDSSFDVGMYASGSIRKEKLGPIITYADFKEVVPYDDALWLVELTGEQFRRIVKHLLREEMYTGDTEFYQFSRGVRIVWNKTSKELTELKLHGKDVTDDMNIKIGIQTYHYNSFTEFFGVPIEEVSRNKRPRIVAQSINGIFEELLSSSQMRDADVEGRIVIVE